MLAMRVYFLVDLQVNPEVTPDSLLRVSRDPTRPACGEHLLRFTDVAGGADGAVEGKRLLELVAPLRPSAVLEKRVGAAEAYERCSGGRSDLVEDERGFNVLPGVARSPSVYALL